MLLCIPFCQWYNSETPEINVIPGRFDKLSPFSRLCMIRVWRTDRVPAAISKFINDTMGQSFVTPPMTILGEVLTSTSPIIPIVLIVKPGSDPPAALSALAISIDFSASKIKYLSLGQGQELVSAFFYPIIDCFRMIMDYKYNLCIRVKCSEHLVFKIGGIFSTKVCSKFRGMVYPRGKTSQSPLSEDNIRKKTLKIG